MANLALNQSPPFPSPPPQESQQEWGYGQIFKILLRRRWWVISVFAGTLITMGVMTVRAQRIYQSATQILIESSYTATGDTGFIDPTLQLDTATQVQVLQSSEILQRAVDKLLADYPNIDLQDLSNNLKVERVFVQNSGGEQKDQTKLLLATYDSTDAIKTQKVLDSVLDVYKSYNLEQQQARITKGLTLINRKLPEVRASVIEAEKALEIFREKNNVIDPQTESQRMTETLNTLITQRQALKAEISQEIANLEVARLQVPNSTPEILASAQVGNSTSIGELKSQVQRLEIEATNLREELTPQHPRLKAVEQQLASAKQLLSAAVSRIGSGRGVSGSDVPESSPTDIQTAQTIQQLEQSIASKQARDRSLAKTQQEIEGKIQVFPELIAQYSRLQPEVEARRSTLEKLLDEKEKLSLEIAKGGFDWEIIEQPQPGILISPDIQRNLLVGIVSGLFLGGLAAFVREALDDKVRITAELDEQLAMPLLGSVPQIDSLTGGREFPLALPFQNQSTEVVLDGPEIFQWRPLREAMDLIFTNIQLLNSHNPHRSLMVTSTLSGEGKSTIAIGLAISASRVDQRVLLIDGDMRRPRLHTIFNLNNEHGLSTLLEGGLTAAEMENIPQWVYMRWGDDAANAEIDANGQLRTPLSDLNIDVVTSGPIQNDPAKLLTVENMKEIIEFYKTQYDLILIDSPPVLGIVDAIPIGYGCDGVIMVARMDQVKRSEMNRALDTLNKLNVVGIIANGVQKDGLQSSYYY